MRELKFEKAICALINTKIGLFLSNHLTIEGHLLEVKPDHVVIDVDQNVHYIPLHHIKALSKNAKDYRETSKSVPYLEILCFSEILHVMKHCWVNINGPEKIAHFGVLSGIGADHIVLVNQSELLYIPTEFITNIHGVLSKQQIQVANEKDKLTNQLTLSIPTTVDEKNAAILLPETIQTAEGQVNEEPMSFELLLEKAASKIGYTNELQSVEENVIQDPLGSAQEIEITILHGTVNLDEEVELHPVSHINDEVNEPSYASLEEKHVVQTQEQILISDESLDSQDVDLVTLFEGSTDVKDEDLVVVSEVSPNVHDEDLVVVSEISSDVQNEELVVVSERSTDVQDEELVVISEVSPNVQDEDLVDVSEGSPDVQDKELVVISEGSTDVQDEELVVVSEISPDVQDEELVVVSEISPDVQDGELVVVSELSPAVPEDSAEEIMAIEPIQLEETFVGLESEPVEEVGLLEPELPNLLDYDEDESDIWGILETAFTARNEEPFSFTEPLGFERDFPLTFRKVRQEDQESANNGHNDAEEIESLPHTIQVRDEDKPVESLNSPIAEHQAVKETVDDVEHDSFVDQEVQQSKKPNASFTLIKISVKDEKAMLEEQYFSLAKHAANYSQNVKKDSADTVSKGNETVDGQYVSLMNHAAKMYQQLLDK